MRQQSEVIALKKRNNNKKFLLSFCVLLVAVAAVSVSLTLALATVDPYTTNVVTIGEVKIELIDKYYDADGDEVGDGEGDMSKNEQTYTQNTPPVFEPNRDVHKTVKVKNTGKIPCYVRLQVQKEWLYQEGATQAFLDEYITWTTNDKWILGEDLDDGYVYYYYTDILQPNTETPGLFEGNVFHIGNYPKQYGSQAIGHIYVKAQAVQTVNPEFFDESFGDKGDLTSTKTFVRNSDGYIVKWNGLIFE